MNDTDFMRAAYEEAYQGYQSGGVPVGAVLVENAAIVGRGFNKRVQEGDPISHGEMDCLRNAGRREDYSKTTIYTTLSPCMMCTGAIIQFGIKRVVIGENVNFKGNIETLQQHGVDVTLLNDPDCTELMSKFVQEKPELWFEDIAGREDV